MLQDYETCGADDSEGVAKSQLDLTVIKKTFLLAQENLGKCDRETQEVEAFDAASFSEDGLSVELYVENV